LITQQSDITIESDGNINISFLWDDLKDLADALSARGEHGKIQRAKPRRDWTLPEASSLPELTGEFLSCKLCPKSCGFNRVERKHPTCGDHLLRVSTFGVTFGDEPEIRGESGSGAIMLSGCPLTCPSCHNPEKVAHGVPTSIRDFLEICRELLLLGAENIQILSPTVHFPHLRVALKILKDNLFPIPIVLKSSGYESVEELQKLNGLVDIYLPDFKFGSCSQWSLQAGVKNYFSKAQIAVHEMIRQVGPIILDERGLAQRGVLIRHVEAPLPYEEKSEIKKFLMSLPPGVRVSYLNHFVSLE
jgi:putative pyruvate formate lyase activating enzyme